MLAGRLGTQGLTPGSQLIVNERESGKMLNEAVADPALDAAAGRTTRAHHAHRAGNALAFTAAGFEGGESVELIPWFRVSPRALQPVLAE